jgi:hypothetical protein
VSTRPPPPRSPVCGTLVLVCTCPAGPTENPHLGALADHRIRAGERTHVRCAIVRDGRSRHGGWRHLRFEGLSPGLALPPPGQGHTASTITAAGHDCTSHGEPGWGQDPRAPSCRKGQSPRPCPRALPSSITHSPMRPKPEGRPAPAAHDATTPIDGYRRGTRGAKRLPLSHPLLAPAM